MNLITDPWIPIIRGKTKKREMIRPFEVTDKLSKNPVQTMNAPRADFNGSLIQFLIGIVQTVLTPKDEEQWVNLFKEPPDQAKLRELMKPIEKYFNLDGDGIRFMQDKDLEGDQSTPIGNLFIDSPGDNGIKNNTDHFIKRGRIDSICAPCTAAALLSLQINAPSGGAGHRTSLRGGGPLTTIAIPDGSQPELDTLWHRIWLNILIKPELKDTNGNPGKKSMDNILPWIGSIKTSEKSDGDTHPQEVHPLQIYWAIPRRIRLGAPVTQKGNCKICSQQADNFFIGYHTKNYGINYTEGFIHPLSPYYQDNKGNKLPTHPQPGGFTYRYWPEFVSMNKGDRTRALVLQKIDKKIENLKDAFDVKITTSVFVFGYDMDNMKPRCWYETQLPYWEMSEKYRDYFNEFASKLSTAASQIAGNTRMAVKNAWFNPNEKVKGDLSFIFSEFWQSTESKYYQFITKIKDLLEADQDVPNDLLEEWIQFLNKEALSIYDFYADQVPIDNGKIDGMPRPIKARDQLIGFNYDKQIRKILGLPDKIIGKKAKV